MTNDSTVERESMEYDVVIVGAGPAGLSAAIRLKQIDPELQVVVLEKGSEVGAHILSGAVLDPSGLDRLIPDWRDKGAPVDTEVTDDNFYVLGEAGGIRVPNWPMPPLMNNHGNYIVSMGNVCRWLAQQAEELGVEIFPGMAASEVVWDGERVKGVVAGEMGLNADGTPGPQYEPGMELHGRYVFIAEGVRGSLAKQIMGRLNLSAGHEPQKYGLGMKEIWEVSPEKFKKGRVVHTMGWPLGRNAGGGSFIYHFENNQVLVGFVVHLNYENPYLYPYAEFQRFKHHPMVAELLEGGKRVAYGARAISEGGWQSMPQLSFAGGVLLLEQSDTSNVHLDVEHALYGNLESLIWLDATGWGSLFDPEALATLPVELPRMAVTLVFVTLFTAIFWRPLKISTFDEGFARTIGMKTGPLGLGLVIVAAIAAVAAFDAVGSIIVIAMFICPPAAARMMTNRLEYQIAWSVLFATLAAVLGYVLAGYGPLWIGMRDSVSAAGMIATVSGVILGLAALMGPHRQRGAAAPTA